MGRESGWVDGWDLKEGREGVWGLEYEFCGNGIIEEKEEKTKKKTKKKEQKKG